MPCLSGQNLDSQKLNIRRAEKIMPQQIRPNLTITLEQIEFFHENGYLAIDAITTPEEVEMMRAVYDRIFEQRAGRDEGNQFDLAGTDDENTEAALPQILDPARYAEELRDTLFRANAHAISKQLLGDYCMPMGEHAIRKPAHYGAPTPWHQDEAYRNPAYEHNNVSVWMPLQEANMENGCMCFIPGSHKLDVLSHHPINHDPRVHGLEVDEEIEMSSAVACPLPPGGATFHASRTLHYTPPNRSDAPRRAYILAFCIPPVLRATPRHFSWNEIRATAREARARASKNSTI